MGISFNYSTKTPNLAIIVNGKIGQNWKYLGKKESFPMLFEE